jgi:hypothetical protein
MANAIRIDVRPRQHFPLTLRSIPDDLLATKVTAFVGDLRLRSTCKHYRHHLEDKYFQNREIAILMGKIGPDSREVLYFTALDLKKMRQELTRLLSWINPSELATIRENAQVKNNAIETILELIHAIVKSAPLIKEVPDEDFFGDLNNMLHRSRNRDTTCCIGGWVFVALFLTLFSSLFMPVTVCEWQPRTVQDVMVQQEPRERFQYSLLRACDYERVLNQNCTQLTPSFWHCDFISCLACIPHTRLERDGIIMLTLSLAALAAGLAAGGAQISAYHNHQRYLRLLEEHPELLFKYCALATRTASFLQRKLDGVAQLPDLPAIQGLSRPLTNWFKQALAEAHRHDQNKQFQLRHARINPPEQKEQKHPG